MLKTLFAHCLQHLLDMTFDADLAPFPHQTAFAINQESAAFYALHLLAVHVLHFDHVEQPAQRFIGIGNQFKRKSLLAFKIFMGFQAIT